MPASITAIMKNIERLQDPALIDLWNQEAKINERTPGEAWVAFVEKADADRRADKIPGSVGRTFKAKYVAEAALAEDKPTAAQRTSSKAPVERARK